MDAQLVTRQKERRRSRLPFVLLERRTGFERRGVIATRLLATLRDSPQILFTLLMAINAMNVVDFVLTVGALRAGYVEGNPLMAFMFSHGLVVAGAFKLACVAAVSVAVWRMRRYRLVLQVAFFAVALLSGVLLVHAYGLAFYY